MKAKEGKTICRTAPKCVLRFEEGSVRSIRFSRRPARTGPILRWKDWEKHDGQGKGDPKGDQTMPKHAETGTIYKSLFRPELLILKWRRRESNPRPKTFSRRVYILIRFRLFSRPARGNLQLRRTPAL